MVTAAARITFGVATSSCSATTAATAPAIAPSTRSRTKRPTGVPSQAPLAIGINPAVPVTLTVYEDLRNPQSRIFYQQYNAMIDSIRAWITGGAPAGREQAHRRGELQLALTALLIEAAYCDDRFDQHAHDKEENDQCVPLGRAFFVELQIGEHGGEKEETGQCIF